MTFLTPIPAIIAGAIAAPLLLLLYFLKLRRRPVRVGSTMLWAQAAEDLQANVPFKWLRPSFLLLLQLLILASLLLALARPALHAPGAMPGQVFIVIDRSASMRAADMPGGGSRFDEAARLARDAVERLAVGSFQGEITLIAYGARADIVAGPTRSRGELLRTIGALQPTDEPGDLASALRLVQALGARDDAEVGDAAPALVVICSDGSTEGDLPALTPSARFARAAPAEPGENIGFVALAAQRDAQAPSVLRIFARVLSTLPDATTVGISVRVDDEVAVREAVELDPASGDEPGQTPVTFQIEVPSGGLVTLSIDRRDALPADDVAALVVGPPRRPAVLLVRQTESEEAGAGWLLTDVLRELDLSALRLISAERLATLGAEAYEGMDLAIFDAAPSPVIPPLASLHFGHPPPLPELASDEGAPGVRPIIAWERSHPLLRDVALDAVRVGRTELLTPAGDARDRGFTELARTAGGVVIAAIEHERLTHVVCGFELVQSTWPVHYSFPIFLANVVETLPRGGTLAAGWYGVTGGAVVLPEPLPRDAGPLLAPDGAARPLPSPPPDAGLRRLGVLERAGVWRIGGSPVPVNLLDARESSLEAPGALPIPGSADGAGRRVGAEGEPREVWPWLLIAAAVLLAIEWLLYGLRLRV